MRNDIDTVMGVYDGFARRDLPGTLAVLADEIEWHEADGLPWGGRQHGPAAVAQNVFANISVKNTAVYPGRYSGNSRGPSVIVAPSSRRRTVAASSASTEATSRQR